MTKFGFGTANNKNKHWIKLIYSKIFGVFYDDYIRFLYFKIFFESKNKIDNIKIYDAGTGEGNYAFYLGQKYPNCHVDAYDLDENLVKSCNEIKGKHKIDNVMFYRNYVEKNTKNNNYDLVLLMGVLVFNADINGILNKLYKNLNKNGKIYLYTPHISETESLNLKFEKSDKFIKDGVRLRPGFSENEISKLLRSSGFRNIEIHRVCYGLELSMFKIYSKNCSLIRAILNPFIKFIVFLKSEIYDMDCTDKGIVMIITATK